MEVLEKIVFHVQQSMPKVKRLPPFMFSNGSHCVLFIFYTKSEFDIVVVFIRTLTSFHQVNFLNCICSNVEFRVNSLNLFMKRANFSKIIDWMKWENGSVHKVQNQVSLSKMFVDYCIYGFASSKLKIYDSDFSHSGRGNRPFNFRTSKSGWWRKNSRWSMWKFVVQDIYDTGLPHLNTA